MTAVPAPEPGRGISGPLNPRRIPLGVQLWSVKKDLALDFDATLATLAETGFSYAEAAGYDASARTIFGFKPGVFLQKIQSARMQLISAHAPVHPNQVETVLEDFSATSVKYLITSMYPDETRTARDYYRIAENYNRIGRMAKSAGIQFGYHNHHFEFADLQGERPFDILLQHTDPEFVTFEMDLGWMVQAGQVPGTYFDAHPGRFPLWHLRDVDLGGTTVNAGDGCVDFHTLHQQKKQAGFLYGIVETPSAATDGKNRVIASFNYINKKQLY